MSEETHHLANGRSHERCVAYLHVASVPVRVNEHDNARIAPALELPCDLSEILRRPALRLMTSARMNTDYDIVMRNAE
jgi:hypothetical protein